AQPSSPVLSTPSSSSRSPLALASAPPATPAQSSPTSLDNRVVLALTPPSSPSASAASSAPAPAAAPPVDFEACSPIEVPPDIQKLQMNILSWLGGRFAEPFSQLSDNRQRAVHKIIVDQRRAGAFAQSGPSTGERIFWKAIHDTAYVDQ